MILAINNPAYWCRVLAQRLLFAALKVDPVDVPVHTGTEGLVVVSAEADVQHGRAVLECPDQRAMGAVLAAGVCVVEVDLLVPRRGQQPRRRGGRKDDGGDGIVWRLRELELGCCEGGGGGGVAVAVSFLYLCVPMPRAHGNAVDDVPGAMMGGRRGGREF